MAKFYLSSRFYIVSSVIFYPLPPILLLQDLSAYNTRLFKSEDGGKVEYEVRLASAVSAGMSFDL